MSWEGLNRRKFPRAKFPCLIKIQKTGAPPEPLLTHTENVSTGGACVIIKRHLEAFSIVDIEIDLMDGEDLLVGKGKVMWVVRRKATEEVKPAFYDTGIEFMSMDPRHAARIEAAVKHILRSDASAGKE